MGLNYWFSLRRNPRLSKKKNNEQANDLELNICYPSSYEVIKQNVNWVLFFKVVYNIPNSQENLHSKRTKRLEETIAIHSYVQNRHYLPLLWDKTLCLPPHYDGLIWPLPILSTGFLLKNITMLCGSWENLRPMSWTCYAGKLILSLTGSHWKWCSLSWPYTYQPTNNHRVFQFLSSSCRILVV